MLSTVDVHREEWQNSLPCNHYTEMMLDTDLQSTQTLLTLRVILSSGMNNEIFHLSSNTLEEQGSLAQSVT